MQSSPEFSQLLFVKALTAFKSGHIPLETLLETAQIAGSAGASNAELWQVLEQRESDGALAVSARAAIHALLWPARDIAVSPDRHAAGGLPVLVTCLNHRYELVEVIAEGPRSRVYKARDLSLSGPNESEWVAIKQRLDDVVSPDDWHSRFQQLHYFDHPMAVRYWDYGVENGYRFLVTEYVNAYSLGASLKIGAMPRDRALPILEQVSEALEAVHAAAMTHGNLTSSHILILPSNAIKLISFEMSDGRGTNNDAMAILQPPKSGNASFQQNYRQRIQPPDDFQSLSTIVREVYEGRSANAADNKAAFKPSRPLLTVPFGALADFQPKLPIASTKLADSIGQIIQRFTAKRVTYKRLRVTPAVQATLMVTAVGLSLVVWLTHRSTPPISIATSRAPASVWSAPGGIIKDCAECPVMRILGPGAFTQGDDTSASRHDKPQHRVEISYFFALATVPVTVGEFQRFAESNQRPMHGCDVYDQVWHQNESANWRLPNFVQTSRHPVTCVSWEDAMAYAAWISTISGHHYRLPSAAEWEYGALAGEASQTPWKRSSDACLNANIADQGAALRYPGWQVFGCEDQYVYTAPVGSYMANKFGLKDMFGNVQTWTADCWFPTYDGAPADGSSRVEEGCSDRESRGSSWFSNPENVRASHRNHFAATYRTSTIGFRLVRDNDT